MHKIPHVLHFITADSPGDATIERIEKIKSLHPGWTTYHWTDSRPPENGRLSEYYQKANSGAQLADLMRLDAVWTFGGIYIDSDFMINTRLDQIAEHFIAFICSEDGEFPTNALFGAVPEHASLEAIIKTLLDHEPDWTQPANEATGPFLFKRVWQWRTDVDVLPRETFYPYNWWEPPRAPHRLSHGIHLWEGSWLSPETRHRTPNDPAKTQDLKTRVQVEIAKLLSTLGFKKAGAALWDKAHDINTVQAGEVARDNHTTYTVGSDVFVLTRHGTTLICDGHDLSITPHLALFGHYELAEEHFLKSILSGGDWYVDVGANIGNHAILAATKVGPFGRVFAFEPNQRCCALVRKSAVVNWVHDRLRVLELGVSDSLGAAQLVLSATQLGGATIETGTSDCFDATLSTLGDRQSLDISTTTLDATFPVDLPIKVLKIDAEGHEAAILRGASRLLSAKAFDYIMVEVVIELAGSRWPEYLVALRKLVGFGYNAARLAEDGSLKRHPNLESALADETTRTIVFHA